MDNLPITTINTDTLKVKVVKIGKQRVISVFGSGSASANAVIFNVDENNIPKSEAIGIVTLMDSSGAISGTTITIDTNGYARFSADVLNTFIYAVLVYEVA